MTVRVLNGSGVAGAAGTLTNTLKAKGYKTLVATDAATRTGTVVVREDRVGPPSARRSRPGAELQGAGDADPRARVARTPTASSSSGADIAADSALADAVRTLRADPASTALVMDFDGTLADIVPRPDDARPRAEVVPLLHALVAGSGTWGS